jgi:cation:H+ antiporter
LSNLILLILGLALPIAGAELLVRGGSSLARRLGLTPLVIGLTVVAFGTSAPEMVVSVTGALAGHGDLAVGNVVGSNIFNIGVILAIAALIAPIHVKLGLLKLDAPFMIVVSLLAVWFAAFDAISRRSGAFMLLLLTGYVVYSVRLARAESDEEISREFDQGVPARVRSALSEVVLIVAGLGMLSFGSSLLVKSAGAIARSFGVSEALIGLTIVAAGTSMPELATSVVAALRGQSDIAIGNVIGSNIFNILGILGFASLLRPLAAPGVGQLDLWIMVAFSVALLPLLWTGRKLQRLEGMLLLAGYAWYLRLLWPS